jgi:hypothetical protein
LLQCIFQSKIGDTFTAFYLTIQPPLPMFGAAVGVVTW